MNLGMLVLVVAVVLLFSFVIQIARKARRGGQVTDGEDLVQGSVDHQASAARQDRGVSAGPGNYLERAKSQGGELMKLWAAGKRLQVFQQLSTFDDGYASDIVRILELFAEDMQHTWTDTERDEFKRFLEWVEMRAKDPRKFADHLKAIEGLTPAQFAPQWDVMSGAQREEFLLAEATNLCNGLLTPGAIPNSSVVLPRTPRRVLQASEGLLENHCKEVVDSQKTHVRIQLIAVREAIRTQTPEEEPSERDWYGVLKMVRALNEGLGFRHMGRGWWG